MKVRIVVLVDEWFEPPLFNGLNYWVIDLQSSDNRVGFPPTAVVFIVRVFSVENRSR